MEQQEKYMKNVEHFQTLMTGLRADKTLDSRTRLKIEDNTKNMMFRTHMMGTPTLAIKQSGEPNHETNEANDDNDDDEEAINEPHGFDFNTKNITSISIGQVATNMGHSKLTHGQSIAIGSAVAKLYREKYNEDPPKHFQWVDGAERQVNSYTEAHRDIIEHCINKIMNK